VSAAKLFFVGTLVGWMIIGTVLVLARYWRIW
jgi:hypothetical protein